MIAYFIYPKVNPFVLDFIAPIYNFIVNYIKIAGLKASPFEYYPLRLVSHL